MTKNSGHAAGGRPTRTDEASAIGKSIAFAWKLPTSEGTDPFAYAPVGNSNFRFKCESEAKARPLRTFA